MTASIALWQNVRNISYSDDFDPIGDYYRAIKTGKITANSKITRTYKHLVELKKDKKSKWEYSSQRANHVIEFFENYLKHSKGALGGKTIKLELWEQAMLAAAFGFVDINGFRKFKRVILIVGKKNGKSLIASGVGLYLLLPDGEAGAEVYAVATKRDQAKIIWLESKRMRNKSPVLRKRIRSTVNELSSPDNEGTFKAVASDADTLDGLNVHGVLMDEIHQWKRGRQLYDMMIDGMVARDQPMALITSTAGTVREDIYDEIYEEAEQIINGYGDPNGYKDEETLCLIYELDKRAEWTDEKCWIKANPNLGVSKKIENLRTKVEKAKQNERLIKNLVCKEFNIRETSAETWLSFEVIDNKKTFDYQELKPKYGLGGVDLSKTTDLTAAAVIFMIPNDSTIYCDVMYWLPEDKFEKKCKEDKVPYDIWEKKGFLRLCAGNVISYKDITAWFVEVQEEKDLHIAHIGYDAWSATYFIEDLQNTFSTVVVDKVYQGKKTLSTPMFSLGADLEAKKVNYNNNPIMKWNLTNVAVDIDKNGNIQPQKSQSAQHRIDGFAALLNAYVMLDRYKEEYMSLVED